MFQTRSIARILFPALSLSLAAAVPSLAVQRGQGVGVRDGSAINGVDQAHQTDCGGRAAEVSGSGNRIDFVGDCPGLTVNGVGNQISIVLRPGAPIAVSGVENVVTWRVNGQGKPKISVQGVDNSVRAAR